MHFVALIILTASIYVSFSARIKTGLVELHLLWIAATGSAIFLFNGMLPALTAAMLCSVIAAFIWLTRELYYLCGDE
jgi:hypothetical protein